MFLNKRPGLDQISRWATLKARMAERWNGGMTESRKNAQNTKGGIAERRSGGKSPGILKDRMTEYNPKS